MLMLAFSLFLSGALAGLLAGVFGIGGGAILVPVLVVALKSVGVPAEVVVHLAVATSLGIVIPTSIRSFLGHRARGAVDLGLLRSWLFVVPAGAILAAGVAALISGAALKAVFAAIALAVGVKMLLNRPGWVLGTDLPSGNIGRLCGFCIGFLSTLMGIGGGVINNTYMTLFGQPIHRAVATSSGVGVLVSIPAVLGLIVAGWNVQGLPPYSAGYVNLLGVALIMPVTLITAPLGVRLSHALSRRWLEAAFGVFLLAVGMQFLFTA